MEVRTDYKEYETSRRWNEKRKIVKKANDMGFRFVSEAVCAMYDAGDDVNKIACIFKMSRRWARHILVDMGRIEVSEKRRVTKPPYFMPEDLEKEFQAGYKGIGSKVDYARRFIEKHPEVTISEDKLADRIKKKKKKLPKGWVNKKNYKLMDQNRTWAYQSDLLDIANDLGCEYITEAIAKLHGLGLYGPDIAKRFGRSESWAITMLDYLGLSKYPRGGTKHHGRNNK